MSSQQIILSVRLFCVVVASVVMSTTVVNPIIRKALYPELTDSVVHQQAYDACMNDLTVMGYECDSI